MKKNEYGFTAAAGMLVIIIIGLMGFVGWYVWRVENESTSSTASQAETQNSPSSTEPVLTDTKEYKGRLISFWYPSDWLLEVHKEAYIDEAIGLKTANYRSGEAPIGGTETKDGASVLLYIAKTSANTIQTVDAPHIRGTVLQSKIKNGEVQLKETTIGGTKAYEFTWQYEGDGSRVVEFVSNGLFVHAVFDTVGDETTQPQYQPFLDLIQTVKLY